MKLNNQKKINWTSYPAKAIVGIALAMASSGISAVAQTPAPDAKAGPEIYQTLYLTNLTQENDANELVTDLRNMMVNAKLYYVPSQGAISLRGTAEEIALAQKIISDLDKTKKIYRLTYTMTEKDGGKTIGVQHFSIIVASGSKTDFKQGSRVPVEVSKSSTSGGSATEMQYLDVGQEIDASLDGYLDGARLRSRVVQSSIVEDKSGVSSQLPVIRQTTLEGTSTLLQGKPLVLGSVDVPGSTRHQEVEVVSELVR
jgi:type II secretory pathway component GspD/PulD (secretin)